MMNKFLQKSSEAENQNTKIKANEFKYDKILNVLNAKGNVKVINNLKDFIIFAEDVTYEKNLEKISSKGLKKPNSNQSTNLKQVILHC